MLVRLVDIVLLRGGPDQLPASPGLHAIVVAANVAVSALVYLLLPKPPTNWQLQLLVGTFVTLLWFRVAFSLANKPERFLQTSAAIFGTTTLFVPALIPMVAALLPYLEKPDPMVNPPAALSVLAAVLGVWLLTVQVRIVRAAFEWHFVAAIIFIVGLNFASALVYGMLFGVPPDAV
ncbi:MAG TPA: hypothetical protein VFS58_10420 [Steroidobacteraceae bacterium]|nr:hypothetical protein [Steroidobacteraceae bacterium]